LQTFTNQIYDILQYKPSVDIDFLSLTIMVKFLCSGVASTYQVV